MITILFTSLIGIYIRLHYPNFLNKVDTLFYILLILGFSTLIAFILPMNVKVVKHTNPILSSTYKSYKTFYDKSIYRDDSCYVINITTNDIRKMLILPMDITELKYTDSLPYVEKIEIKSNGSIYNLFAMDADFFDVKYIIHSKSNPQFIKNKKDDIYQ